MTDPINRPIEQTLSETIHRLMRTLRRRPSDHPYQSRSYRRLLWILSTHDGASAKELSQLLDIRPASLAELLAKAEAQGLINRVRNDADQRMINTYLAETGREVIRTMKSRTTDDEIYDGILTKAETAMLINLCKKLTQGLEEKFQLALEDTGRATDADLGETDPSTPEEV